MYLKILPLLSVLALLACTNEPKQAVQQNHEPPLDSLNQVLNPKDTSYASTATSPPSVTIDTLPIHLLKPNETLWNLARKEYGNRHYSAIVALYNNIDEPGNLSAGDTILMPPLQKLLQDPNLGLAQVMSNSINQILKARSLFMSHEKALFELRKSAAQPDGTILLPKTITTDLQAAIALSTEAINTLEELASRDLQPPYKMIGQLKSLNQNLQALSLGKNDGPYGYDIDMVHQRLVQAFKNAIYWARNDYQ